MMPSLSRRELLAIAGALGSTLIAGCIDGDSGTETPDSDDSPAEGDDGDDSPDSGDGSASDDGDTPSGEDLDLVEANVVGVETERDGERVSFDVTLHHDDDGEEGYANWWQVETLDGEQVGRRVLTHAHSKQPFTRSDTFEVSADTTCVVVRGHDETHGYGGRAMLVNLDSGETNSVEQGSDRQSVSSDDCP